MIKFITLLIQNKPNFKFWEGYEIDWQTILLIILILVFTSILTRIVRWSITKSFKAASAKLNLDPTRYKFFKNAASLVLWFSALAVIISLIPKLKAFSITLFASAGILVAIIGLAAQQAFSNIISGVFIVLFKPFRANDWIKVGTLDYGVVEDITLRHTVIRNFENKRIIIPNSIMSTETIINDHIEDEKICRWIEVGISYDSDVELASKILEEESEKHPECIDNRTDEQKKQGDPKVVVRMIALQDFSVVLRANVWVAGPEKAFKTHCDILKSVKKRFDNEGIEIPYPHRTIVYKNEMKHHQ